MGNIRLIPRLDIKGANLIKGIHLEGLRVIGDPNEYAVKYYNNGADELIFMDAVASLYERNNLTDIIKKAARNVFIPITVGGGIRSIDDAKSLLRNGADKLAINTAAIREPSLITKLSEECGSQCVVISIEAKRQNNGDWEAYIDNGRERTGKKVIDWCKEAISLGAGQILLTSVDNEGTKKGFDIELIKEASTISSVPLVVSGGMGEINHFIDLAENVDIQGVAIANLLHYGTINIQAIRDAGLSKGLPLREIYA